MRIDRLTSKEDEQLIEWSWEAAFSSAYEGVLLSDLEYGVKAYHDTLKEYFPVLSGPGLYLKHIRSGISGIFSINEISSRFIMEPHSEKATSNSCGDVLFEVKIISI